MQPKVPPATEIDLIRAASRRLVRELGLSADGRTKPLSLTGAGEAATAGLDGFARGRAGRALARLTPRQRNSLAKAFDLFADALAAERVAAPGLASGVTIETCHRPGALARCVEMHALHYAALAGFGRGFEAKVAGELAEFSGRLDRPCNRLWLAVRDSTVEGTIAIDGEDMAPAAHLRWFITADDVRGQGVGRRLLSQAVAFCDQQGFAETRLWTFRGLDAARHLYEAHGFRLVDERAGRTWGEPVIEQCFVRQGRR
jgi:GNAT superfamily N-acetyltransferase